MGESEGLLDEEEDKRGTNGGDVSQGKERGGLSRTDVVVSGEGGREGGWDERERMRASERIRE